MMNGLYSSYRINTKLWFTVRSCGYPGAPAHSKLSFTGEKLSPGVVATYNCDRGFELLGPVRRVCTEEGTWTPEGIPFCGKLKFPWLH